MKILSTLVLVLIVSFSFAQKKTILTVLDSESKTPLAYCNVQKKATNTGGITNNDGRIILRISENDTITLSYIGYRIVEFSYSQILNQNTVYLDKVCYELNEISISANNDYLYKILEKCRRKLLENGTERTSKAYYTVETQTKDSIMEFLECYYNSRFTGSRLNDLYLKQGRFGIAPVGGNYFLSYGVAKAFAKINLLKNNDFFPLLPTQCKKRKVKRTFDLKLIGATPEYLIIEFTPKNKKGFYGNVVVEKNSFNILKMSFNIDHTNIHPFTSLYPSSDDRLSDMSINMEFRFMTINNESFVDLINFNFSFNYYSDRSFGIPARVLTRKIDAKSTIYFYDHNKPFILPYLDFENNRGDYYSISCIPYNEVFWAYRDSEILLTEEQRQGLNDLLANGKLVNYKKLNPKEMELFGESNGTKFSDGEFLFWKKDKRIIAWSMPYSNVNDTKAETYSSHTFNLKVQILLDITECKDSLHCRSFTVYDTPNTFYYYPKDETSDAFINIFFDICEIERRKMQAKLNMQQLTLSEIDSLYNETILEMESITSQYIKEVKRGLKTKAFDKWNKYIIGELNIDNVSMCKEAWKTKQQNEPLK